MVLAEKSIETLKIMKESRLSISIFIMQDCVQKLAGFFWLKTRSGFRHGWDLPQNTTNAILKGETCAAGENFGV